LRIKDCIEKGHLAEIEPNVDFAGKEMKEAEADLKTSAAQFGLSDFKWTTIQAYYAMFHAAKAVLFKAGFKEKAHYAIGIVLQDFAEKGLLEQKHVEDYKAGIYAREQADYHYAHSKETAKQMLEMAKEFVGAMKKLYARV